MIPNKQKVKVFVYLYYFSSHLQMQRNNNMYSSGGIYVQNQLFCIRSNFKLWIDFLQVEFFMLHYYVW